MALSSMVLSLLCVRRMRVSLLCFMPRHASQVLAAAGLRPVTLAPWAGRLALVAATGKSNAVAAAAVAAAGAAGTGLGVGPAGGVEASVMVVGALSNSVRWRWQRWWQQQKMMQMPVG